MAHIWSIAYKEKIKKYFDKQVYLRDFYEGNLILRKIEGPRKEVGEGKVVANQERPYRIIKTLQNGPYRLESIDGKMFPRTWNSSYLHKYYI